MSRDTVFVRDLRIETIIGVWEWERHMPQTISVDLDLAIDARRAADSDRVEDTVDYKRVAAAVGELVRAGEFRLVETAAERIAAHLLDEFGVAWVRVRVNKPGALRDSREVGVVIERGQPASG